MADPTKTGWALAATSGGTLGAVATFELTGATGALQTFVGVFPSTPTSAATIPVDDNVGANRFTGYAVANTGNNAITVDVQEIYEDGTIAASLSPLNIAVGKQIASFLFQDSKAIQTFRGSAVFIARGGATFSILGLKMNHGVLASIPSMPLAAGAPACTAPTVFTQPESPTIASGQSVTLKVLALGTSPQTYQWYRGSKGDTSSPISGATSNTYTTPALTSTTSYWVRVSNPCGSVDSRTAIVTVSSGTADVVFALSLSGAGSLQFQGQTLTTVPIGGIAYFKNLSPGTYEMTGTVGGYGTVGIAFANGGGEFGTGGVVPGSIKSLVGPPSTGTIVSACSVYYTGVDSSSQPLRLQFTVTTATSAACQMGQ